jgi:hypothetical protein
MKRLAIGIGVVVVLFALGLGLARGREADDHPQGATTVFSTTYYIWGVEIRPETPLLGSRPQKPGARR